MIADDTALHEIWCEAVNATRAAYDRLIPLLQEKYGDMTDKTLRRKLARQAARSVLPNATETKIFVTANVRALRHFIEMRGSEHADVEIRKLALGLLEVVRQEAPSMFADYTVETLADGTRAVRTPHPKV